MLLRRTLLAATATVIALPSPGRNEPLVAWQARDLQSGEPGTRVALVARPGLAPEAGEVLARMGSRAVAWERCALADAWCSHVLVSTDPVAIECRAGAYGCFDHDAPAIAADLACALLLQTHIAVDFEDVATVLAPHRVATATFAHATGPDRTEIAVREALVGIDVRREYFLLSLAFPPGDVKLAGCKRALNALRWGLQPDATVIYAVASDPGLATGSMRATVIAS